MKIEDKLAKQDAKRDMNDETKEIIIPERCINKELRTEVRRAKDINIIQAQFCSYCTGYDTSCKWYKVRGELE